jgi:hypothetical protein
LVNAKQRYVGGGTSGGFSVYDEKSMIEATLYGLPMVSVTAANPPVPIGGSNVTTSDVSGSFPSTQIGSLDRVTYKVDINNPDPTQHDTTYGTYFSVGDEVQAWPGRPIQPRVAFDLGTVNNKPPRGQLLREASYEDFLSFDPVVVIPLTEDSMPEPAFNAPGWYPSKLWGVNRFGDQYRSTLVLGQFDAYQAVERLYDNVVLDTYYSDSADYDPPVIWGLASEIAGETGFAATVEGAQRVLVAYNVPNEGSDTGMIKSAELSQDTLDPSLWTLIPAPAEVLAATDYFIQAIDEAGNVAVASKEGFHSVGGDEPDAFQSIGTTRTVSVTLEFDDGGPDGLDVVEIGTKAQKVALTDESVGIILSETCTAPGTNSEGECFVEITSGEQGDSILEIEFDTAFTKAKFIFVTRWWAGTADINKIFEMTPYTLGIPSASFTLSQLDGQGNSTVVSTKECTDGSNGCYHLWENLAAGSYLLAETTVDPAHDRMDDIKFVIDLAHQDFHAPTRENPLLPTTLNIFKTVSGGSDWNGPDLEFEIYNCGAHEDCSGEQFLAAKSLMAEGTDQVSVDLTEGVFLVKEIDPLGIGPLEGDQVIKLLAGESKSLTFTNPAQGCSPGFWQGGNGSQLWNVVNDPDWSSSGGDGINPYIHTTEFNTFAEFTAYGPAAGKTMYDLVTSGGSAPDWQKAARNVVAAYLNASWGMAFPYSPAGIAQLWDDAVLGNNGVTFIEVHNLLGAANTPQNGTCPAGQ